MSPSLRGYVRIAVTEAPVMRGPVFSLGQRLLVIVRSVLVLVALAALLGGIACERQVSSDKLTVVATIFPLADFVKNVAGDNVEVVTLLPAGANPHTYDMTPRNVKVIADAKLLVMNGAGLDFWVEKVGAAARSDLLVVDTSTTLEKEGLLLSGDADDAGGHNPHFWLDPELAQKQVAAIAEALATVDPTNRDVYLGNAAKYIDQLKSLDAEISAVTDNFSIREFISSHPSWEYFAQKYALAEVAVIEQAPGREDYSVKYTIKVIDAVKEHDVKVIFAEVQFSTKSADTIAYDTGAEVLLLDSIGGVSGRDSYIAMMRYNVGLMAEAMQ
jgi:zinc transport system substrate-binding protein